MLGSGEDRLGADATASTPVTGELDDTPLASVTITFATTVFFDIGAQYHEFDENGLE